jgi:hypothetical protein
MSFTEASNKITQTGTDADLSRLNGITGVTTTVRANHTTYTIASTHSLQVTGTLSIDPAYETLQLMKQAVNSGSFPLTVTDTLNLGVKTTANGKDKYSVGVGIDLPNENTSGQMFNTFGISFGGSSTFLWNGGIIRTTATLRTAGGATVTINNGIFYNLAEQSANTSQFRIESTNSTGDAKINIYDLTFDGEAFESRIFTKSGWNVGIFKFKKGAYQSFNSSFPPLTFENFDTSPNLHDSDVINVTRSQVDGETITIKGFSNRLRVELDSGRNNFMYLKCVRPISLVVEDLDGNELTYSYYAKDLDSGNRALGSKNQDDTSDKTYSGVNQSGNLDADVLVEVINYINKTITTDSRTNSNSEIPFSIIAYNQTITDFAEDLVGLNTLESTVKMTPDLVVSEATKSVVDAYTSIDTPQKFYDIAKSYLVGNYAGEASPLVSRDGNTIDAGGYDVVVDASAGSVFAISGNTLTIKASTFVGNISTSGSATLSNGAKVIGTFGATTVLPWEVKNVEATTRLQLYNLTKDALVITQKLSGTAGTYVDATGTYDQTEISVGDVVRLRCTCVVGATAMLPVEVTGVATSTGITFQVDQIADEVYNSNSIDGSTVSKTINPTSGTLTADYSSPMGVDVSDADGTASVKEIYAFFVYSTTTEDGVENWFGGMRAIDNANYEVVTANADIKIQNIGTNAVIVSDGRLFRDDSASVLFAKQGDKPISMDSGALVTSVQPQVEAALNANAKISSINNNSKLIPSLL